MNGIYIGMLLCFGGYMLLLGYIYRGIYPPRSKAALFKEELNKFIENIDKFKLEEGYIEKELRKFESYKTLRKRNKKLEKLIKKYNL